MFASGVSHRQPCRGTPKSTLVKQKRRKILHNVEPDVPWPSPSLETERHLTATQRPGTHKVIDKSTLSGQHSGTGNVRHAARLVHLSVGYRKAHAHAHVHDGHLSWFPNATIDQGRGGYDCHVFQCPFVRIVSISYLGLALSLSALLAPMPKKKELKKKNRIMIKKLAQGFPRRDEDPRNMRLNS